MLKKFWNYQLLLSRLAGSNNVKKSLTFVFFNIFIYMLVLITLDLIFGDGGFIFYTTVFALYAAYSIINSQNKLYEIVPVSKLYSLINIYLFVFIAITLPTTILLIFERLMTQLNFDSSMSVLINSWKPIVIIGCTSTIVASILLPIFFIKLNTLRKTLTLLVVVLIPIVLLLFKNTLPVVTELGTTNFWKSIAIMPHYNEFLLILVCVSLVTIPISMLISHRLYKGKRCSLC
ncbi:hypothetical protein G9F73_013610 [Clostridium estertheticum]|uniref:hypothetical protein n=1 Tax=Clostridium estertheticum TaxID=238834 RepID=UPI0013EEE8F7|nr:hypothetical protein [Clostridium estertheticum]MBZ9608840.1 hypothetical protein [Clostridium estertheticum]